MIKRIAATLLCTVAPVALTAQDVDLRSPDEFISVEGQIVGYNGVMLRVQTSVGTVSVPASEVICYGPGCLETLANNDFGLTEDAFQSVVAVTAQELVERSDDMQVAFSDPAYGTLFTTLAGAFAVGSNSATTASLSSTGITMESEFGNETATLTIADSSGDADIVLETTPLNGTQPIAYSGPEGWAAGNSMSHQMVGLSAYSVMVAPNASINSITMNDLARIFAGEITNWSQIGGADVNILPLQLPADSAMGQEIQALVLGTAGKTVAGNVLTMADEGGIATSINQFPGSISIVSAAGADESLTVPVAGSCGLVVEATPFNIASGDYPLLSTVMANYDNKPQTDLVTEMFDFASAEIAQELIAQEGWVNHSALTQTTTEKNTRLSGLLGASLDDAQRTAAASMFQVLFDADRLSPTMVGGAVSGPEAAWNRAMMIDLLAVMSDPANAGREFLFVGKGDGTSGSQAAISNSAMAAQAVKDAVAANAADIIASGDLTLSHFGFGNVSPATCVDGQVASSDYTRIEVWLR